MKQVRFALHGTALYYQNMAIRRAGAGLAQLYYQQAEQGPTYRIIQHGDGPSLWDQIGLAHPSPQRPFPPSIRQDALAPR